MNVGIFFGGKSVEHEMSIASAIHVMSYLNRDKYKVIPIYITKEGEFYTSNLMFNIENFADINELLDKSTNINVSVNEKEFTLINNESGLFFKKIVDKLDVAFPILHGTGGEDGSIQGLFEVMNIPYVGSNVLAAATSNDKITMKMILKETSLPIVEYLWFYTNTYFNEKEKIIKGIEVSFGLPVVVKPANLGLSIGIKVANTLLELEDAIDSAASFSSKIVIEKKVEDLREVSCSVFGDYAENYVSVCEEAISTSDILKYAEITEKGIKWSERDLPAKLSDEFANKIKKLAKMAFITLNCSGITRIDFLINEKTKEIYINDVNNVPPYLAAYLWEATGVRTTDLMEKLIECAIRKSRDKNKLIMTLDDKNKKEEKVSPEEMFKPDKNISKADESRSVLGEIISKTMEKKVFSEFGSKHEKQNEKLEDIDTLNTENKEKVNTFNEDKEKSLEIEDGMPTDREQIINQFFDEPKDSK